MPLFELVPHPAFPTGAASAVKVTLAMAGRDALLRYELPDPVGVAWPNLAEPARAEGLWRTTCFELFLMFADGEQYVEFNFSPSTRWASYAFDGYRERMSDLPMRVPPSITRIREGADVVCPLGELPRGEMRLGLSAVIEQIDGSISYWALAHAPGPPDFHNPACFTARLPAPAAP